MSYLPTFQTTSEMLNLVAEIIELVGAFDLDASLVPNPTIRKINQIRSVHSSAWIEGNTLSFDEATAVINGKHVIAPKKEILEVKQAFEAYEKLVDMDVLSLDDLLHSHGIMMENLAKDAGKLRAVEVGVYSGTTLIHAGVPAKELPQAMEELFSWLKTSNDHPLIRGCFFHCAFEGIHPFVDGNGRTGRLWHSLIYRTWKPVLAWVPVESMIAEHQQDYYRALRVSNAGDATTFIEFMLEMTRDALTEVFVRAESGDYVGETPSYVGENVGKNLSDRIADLLEDNPRLSAAKLAKILGISKRHTERLLADLRDAGRIERVGAARGGRWVVKN